MGIFRGEKVCFLIFVLANLHFSVLVRLKKRKCGPEKPHKYLVL